MTKLTEEKKQQFLEILARGASVTKAAKAMGFTRQAAYQQRDLDGGFKAAWDDAVEQGLDRLEDCALEMATTGNPTMLIFMLKSKRRGVFGDEVKNKLTGADGESPAEVVHRHMWVR